MCKFEVILVVNVLVFKILALKQIDLGLRFDSTKKKKKINVANAR